MSNVLGIIRVYKVGTKELLLIRIPAPFQDGDDVVDDVHIKLLQTFLP
jgi:hypothetical protein